MGENYAGKESFDFDLMVHFSMLGVVLLAEPFWEESLPEEFILSSESWLQ